MLLQLPDSWPTWAVGAVAMVLLAAVDLSGSLVAKEAVLRRSQPLALLGAALFLLLFWIFASTLQYAELACVTFGWIAVLQVGVLLVDRFRYGARLPAGAWVAAAVMIAAQGYLLAVSGAAGHDPARSGPQDPPRPEPPAAERVPAAAAPGQVPAGAARVPGGPWQVAGQAAGQAAVRIR